ncbi:MAG: AAA family ATPase [Corynebacterium sp.]|uniref:AAA family ATPase n=1 Tax=Corynebacterium sp. TaxID=1720 RepID=UPI003F0B050E
MTTSAYNTERVLTSGNESRAAELSAEPTRLDALARRVQLEEARTKALHVPAIDALGWKLKKKAHKGRTAFVDADGTVVAERTVDGCRLLTAYTRLMRGRGEVTVPAGTDLDTLSIVALSRGLSDAEYVAERRQAERDDRQLRAADSADGREAWQTAREEAALLEAFNGRSPAQLWAPPSDYDERVQAVFSGDYEPVKPAVLARVDGANMLYPGCTHSIYGEPGSGKSWLAVVAAAQQIAAGHPVLYLDYEDDTEPTLHRLALLGCKAADVTRYFVHVRPEAHPAAPKPGDSGIRAALRRAFVDRVTNGHRGQPFALVVVDGVTNAMALAGYNPNANDEATLWDREVPRTIAEQSGAAVLTVDHTAKAGNGGRYAIGAQSKLANVTGAAYRVDVVEGSDPLTSVNLAIFETKDRKHGVTVHTERTEAGRLFGHFLLQSDTARPGGLEGVVITPAGAKDRQVRAAAREREELLSQSGAPLDVALKAAGGTIPLPTLVAVVVAFYGGDNGMTRQQIDAAVQRYGPAVWQRLDGRTAEKLRTCKYLKQRGEKYRLVEGAEDMLDERARRVLEVLRTPPDGIDEVGVDPAPAGPFGSIG